MKNKLAIKKNIKNFNKYFFQTFKTGKYLLIKYIGTAILMSVIAVLSNLLQVEDLTYLNAVLAVDYFSNMISFGIYTGTTFLQIKTFLPRLMFANSLELVSDLQFSLIFCLWHCLLPFQNLL